MIESTPPDDNVSSSPKSLNRSELQVEQRQPKAHGGYDPIEAPTSLREIASTGMIHKESQFLELRHLLEELQMIDWQDDVPRAVNEFELGLWKALEVWIKYRLDYVIPGYETRTAMVMPHDLRRSMLKSATVHEESL